jgi:hypothetical protein
VPLVITKTGETMYRFPKTIFTYNAPFVQLEHIKSEMLEVVYAYDNEQMNRVAEEVLDLIHSCETFLRILEQRQAIDVPILHDLIVEKNRLRGYYAK